MGSGSVTASVVVPRPVVSRRLMAGSPVVATIIGLGKIVVTAFLGLVLSVRGARAGSR